MNIPIHILLADDDESDRLLFVEAIELVESATIATVNNGTELMDYLNKGSTVLPDILFLDLNMPRKNGMECLKELRSSKKFNGIYIAIFSTSASEKDIEQTFALGANAYIKKPNNFEVLIDIVKKVILAAEKHEKLLPDKSNFLLRV